MSDGRGDMLLMPTCVLKCLAINDAGCADLSEGFVIEKHNQRFSLCCIHDICKRQNGTTTKQVLVKACQRTEACLSLNIRLMILVSEQESNAASVKSKRAFYL